MRPTDLLRQLGRPIAYYPNLVKFFSSVNATVLFCQLFYWHDKAHSELGVYKTTEEITEETGLSYKEQLNARKQLKALGVLIENNKRLEHKIYYKVDIDKVNEILGINIENSPPSQREVREQPKESFGETPNGDSLYTEITTKTTTENKKINKKSSVTVPDMINSLSGLSEDVAVDYLKHRKDKGATLSPRAWAGICREVNIFTEKTKLTPDDALIEAIERDWKGLKADWLIKSLTIPNSQSNQHGSNEQITDVNDPRHWAYGIEYDPL